MRSGGGFGESGMGAGSATRRRGEESKMKCPLQAGHLSFAALEGIRSGESVKRFLQWGQGSRMGSFFLQSPCTGCAEACSTCNLMSPSRITSPSLSSTMSEA